MKTSGVLLLAYYVILFTFTSCAGNRNIISKLIKQDPFLFAVASNPEYEVQVIFTTVDKKKDAFKSSAYHLQNDKYFYPASTVKMPVAILALQKLREWQLAGTDIKLDDIMLTAGIDDKLGPALSDTTNTNKKPSIERYIQKIFAVSDNDAYNRLYEMLGQDYINQTLHGKGVFTNSVINHRLNIPGLSKEDNRRSNNIRFFRDQKLILDIPESIAQKEWNHHAIDAVKGVGYLDANDSLIYRPFDFTGKNFYSLQDMEATLQRIIFPQYFEKNQQFDLTSGDYDFLKKCMSDLPKTYTHYADHPEYYDSYVKFLMFGDSKEPIPDSIRIYNKVGNAYGYLIDCAYIENRASNTGFFLTAVIHVNKNRIYNDGKYEYEEIGYPFLARLGKKVYEYHLKK